MQAHIDVPVDIWSKCVYMVNFLNVNDRCLGNRHSVCEKEYVFECACMCVYVCVSMYCVCKGMCGFFCDSLTMQLYLSLNL